jgi:hypothetical protein
MEQMNKTYKCDDLQSLWKNLNFTKAAYSNRTEIA